MGRQSQRKALGKGVRERIRVAKRAGRVTIQVMRGEFAEFEKMARDMSEDELGKELERLVQAPTNFQNRKLVERMIQILSDEVIRRGEG